MHEPATPILATLLNRAAVLYNGLHKGIKSRLSQSDEASDQPEPGILSCRVQVASQQNNGSSSGAFVVEIVGPIRAASDTDYATLQVLIMDVTEGTHRTIPVRTRAKQWQIQDVSPPRLLAEDKSGGYPPVFCYRADLGQLPERVTTVTQWTAVAHVDLDWLLFPRRGGRVLHFRTSILSRQSGQELACAECRLVYENPTFGYIDLHENSERAKTLAVALALAVSAADNRLYSSEIELIKSWAKANIGCSHEDTKSQKSSKIKKAKASSCLGAFVAEIQLDQALDQAVDFFRNGNQLDVRRVCTELAEIAPPADRYDILELCLRVAGAKGSVAAEELAILKSLAAWLEVGMDKFRTMMEKWVPVNMHQVKDVEVILGLTSDMSKEKTRRQLNREYGKWNSRVCNCDPEIQAQADQMLRLIAEARSQLH